jgi:hypothetical protein
MSDVDDKKDIEIARLRELVKSLAIPDAPDALGLVDP